MAQRNPEDRIESRSGAEVIVPMPALWIVHVIWVVILSILAVVAGLAALAAVLLIDFAESAWHRLRRITRR